MLELPYQLLETLIEIDNQLGSWRYRHINMVRRMIGTRIGTGGSTGAGYLQGAMDKHYIFRDITTEQLPDRRKNYPYFPRHYQPGWGSPCKYQISSVGLLTTLSTSSLVLCLEKLKRTAIWLGLLLMARIT